MYIGPDKACAMPSGTSPLNSGEVAARRAEQRVISQMIADMQNNVNRGVFESPWDWQFSGLNTMRDVARSNAQRWVPGFIPPVSGDVPGSILPRRYAPGVLTPDQAGVSVGPVARADTGTGSLRPSPARYNGGHYGGSGRGRRAGRGTASPTGGTGAGSGLIGAPYTQPIAREGAPMASVQPQGAGTTPATPGPNGATGFTGRAETCDVASQGVEILGPQTGTPPTPKPDITIDPQPVDPPLIGGSGFRTRYGLSGAYPMSVSCKPSSGVPEVQAGVQEQAQAAQGASGGISPWWWLLVVGLGIWLASGEPEQPPKGGAQPKPRRGKAAA